jgi:hypothetical protein
LKCNSVNYSTVLYSTKRVVLCHLQSSFSSMPTSGAGTYDTQFSAPSFRLAFTPNCDEDEEEDEDDKEEDEEDEDEEDEEEDEEEGEEGEIIRCV